MKKKKLKKYRITLYDVIVVAVFSVLALLTLYPFYNVLIMSLSNTLSVAKHTPYLLPYAFDLTGYKTILQDMYFLKAFMVSLFVTIVGTSVNMFLSVTGAYVLSKRDLIGRKFILTMILFTMLFSGGLVPTFMVINKLHMMDTFWALVLPGAVPVFNVIILMNFFKAIPQSLEESAYVDGAGPWVVLGKIFLPLSKAPLATIGLFAVVSHWNSYFDGKIYINSMNRLPLQTYIQSLSSSLNTDMMASMTAEEVQEMLAVSSLTFNSAKVIVSMVPILLLYPFLQRYFVTGMVVGAVKE